MLKTMQVTFLTNLVPFGPLASEKKIEIRMDEGEIIDRYKMMTIINWVSIQDGQLQMPQGITSKRCNTKFRDYFCQSVISNTNTVAFFVFYKTDIKLSWMNQ